MKIPNSIFYRVLSAVAVGGGALGCSPFIRSGICVSTQSSSTVSGWDGTSISGTTAIDRTGKNNGTLTSDVTTTTGLNFQAFSLNGSSASISIPSSTSLNPTSGFTISAWVKSSLDARSNTTQTILSKWGLNGSTAFSQSSNWGTVNIGASNTGLASSVFDGRYLYFGAVNSQFLSRYDTQSSFTSLGSWITVNVDTILGGGGGTYLGYQGLVFDGRYVYFVPFSNGSVHGNAVRYDTQGTFNPGSGAGGWTGVNIAGAGILGANYMGFTGGIFDGRYVYFIPYSNGARSGYVARYDTQGTFSPGSGAGGWTGVNIAGAGILGANYKGFWGGRLRRKIHLFFSLR